MAATKGPSPDPDDEINEDEHYDRFPSGTDPGHPHGPPEGFNTWVRINDPELFTEAAQQNPVIREFLAAPFSVSYAQFKSSHRETEYAIHKPHRAFSGQVDGIEGQIEGFPGRRDDQQIVTMVLNHERTLAKKIMRAMVIQDDRMAGQVIHKEEDGSSS